MTTALLCSTALVTIPIGSVSAATAAQNIASYATSQLGAGPCSNTASGSTNGNAGYYAPHTTQNNSCSHPGTAASPPQSGQAQAWCADFAGWAWSRAGVTVDGNLSDGASSFYIYAKAHNTWSTAPRVGDAVYFDSTIYGGHGHVAIVTNVHSDGTFDSVGGNEGDSSSPYLVRQDTGLKVGEYVWSENNVGVYVEGFAGPVGGTPTATLTSIGTWNGSAANYNSSQTVSGTVTLTAGETAASKVWYYLDDTNPAANGGAGLISASDSGGGANPTHNLAFNTAGLSAGGHTITAAAFDGTNTSQIDSVKTVTITVNNTPSTPTVSVPGGQAVGTVSLSSTDLSGNTASVVYTIDGNRTYTSTAGGGFPVYLDSTTLADGVHTVTAAALNVGGAASTASTTATFTVNNFAHASSVVDQSGTTSIFTADASNGHVIDTSVSSAGVINVYDLTVHNGTPATSGNPVAAVDGKGTVSVLTRDGNGHLFDTSITSAGAINLYDWTASSSTPAMAGDASAVVDPSGTLSIFTHNAADGHVIDSSVTSAGALNVYDLTVHNGTPATSGNPVAAVDGKGTVSVLTRDGNGHLFDTSITSAGAINLYDWTASSSTPAMAGGANASVGTTGTLSIYTCDASNGNVIDSSVTSTGVLNVYDLTAHNGTPTI
ncbi:MULTISPECIES: CHAP domain-containing protein [unclassified Kitasatospora]|uniref:CHAP domain-containing protein n=3 Tax=Kitasatospora TaxID=2063 RepID=UPI002473DB14|nr:CHAP domain-containing protein [Kitasatospora sp. MAP12-44]